MHLLSAELPPKTYYPSSISSINSVACKPPIMAAPSGYELEFPSTVPATDKLRDFIPSFFQLSDDAARNEEWVEYFCPDATLIMGEDEAQGTESE